MDDSKVGGGDAGRGAGVGVAWAPANETTDNSSKVETLKRFTKPNILIIKCPQNRNLDQNGKEIQK